MASGMTRDPARPLGIVAAALLVVAQIAYAGVLAGGLLTPPSDSAPIADPWFTLMELLILAIAPLIVVMMAVVHVSASGSRKVFSLIALTFTALLAVTTSGVHFTILVLARHPDMVELYRWLSFEWPSPVYALDILAWDVFFGFAVIAAAFAFERGRLALWIRGSLLISGALAFAGLAGVPLGDMQVRNIGIIGYGVVFPFAVGLIGVHFARRR